MRKCPRCGTTYTDETLRFCLADGSPLNAGDEEVTVVQSGPANTSPYSGGGQMRVDIPQSQPQTNFVTGPTPAKDGPGIMKILLVVGLFGVLLLFGLIGAGALIYFNKDSRPSNPVPENTTTNRSTQTPAVNSETDKLREQIANLEKRLDEQKNSNKPLPSITPSADQPTLSTSTARVNSPGDGFLALRSFPSSDSGERITQIPHGASVSISGCLPRTRIGSKTGRWCRASYGSFNGWVFDAWLIY